MAYKCCNYTDNTSPTLDQCKAVETKWNNFCNTYFTTIDNKYPSIDLNKVDLNQGTNLIQNANTRAVKKHATTNRPLYTVMTVDLDVLEVADEVISAIRLKGHIEDVEDGFVFNDYQIMLNSQRMIVGVAAGMITIADLKEDMGDPTTDPPRAADPDRVSTKGLTTLISENKVTLRTHEGHMQYGDYIREEIIITEG